MTPAAVYAQPNLLRFICTRMLIVMAMQVQAVALGWFVYAQTGSALSLGLIGLAQFLPSIPLLAIAGYAADHYDRRKVVMASQSVQAIGALGLYACVHLMPAQMLPIYLMAMLIAGARSFSLPATASLLPNIVTREQFPQAVAFSSSSMQFAAMVGPAIGGFLYAGIGEDIFLALVALPVCAAVLIFTVKAPPAVEAADHGSAWKKAVAGFSYVRHHQLILGAMSLDLFAVLLGGVTALLPIFAQDILHVGPGELGILRSGPTFGALLVGIALMWLPVNRRAGGTMLWSVVVFGIATIVFGLSTDFLVSLAALIVIGGSDMVSLVIRQTMIQMATPDAMRGRVSAVNSVFVGASNQLGSFEAGVMASLLGAAAAAVVGGFGTLLVVAAIAFYFPDLRKADRLHGGEKPSVPINENEIASISGEAEPMAATEQRPEEGERNSRDEVRACVSAPEAGRSAGPKALPQ
ncbi:MFS transporter [Bradyrhizobium sp. LHD-71]|uniref:MFS transporter n=1 Tax=Bradyrhizobium sp. LHD-71 TaxID=3072141 RepID=UPI00280FABF7|nr:MFS transporter [Bradyrhizobium sp. LHD-71]MDQ8730290.1 MFS transporter [Bradyrhizobium sp. LHD-71]